MKHKGNKFFKLRKNQHLKI